MDNTVVLQKDGSVMNEHGLRSEDELVKHKMLDAVGDLALAGGILLAKFESHNPGHSLNNLILKELFSSPDNWSYETPIPKKLRVVV
jgi:UDP-3-O-[3-hydroxymyristoyl] N-acetylglucosamine deacetylase